MGTFDVLVVSRKCEQCGSDIDAKYQFKYGTPWQRRYTLGDRLIWEGQPHRWNGHPDAGLVVADAELEPCPRCKYEFSVVYIDNGVFIGAGRNNGRFRFSPDEYALPIDPPAPPIEDKL